VSRSDRARRIVTGAAYSGGGAVGLLGSLVGLLWAQSVIARRRVGHPKDVPFEVDGRYEPARPRLVAAGDPTRGPEVRMVMLGDSGGAGLGAAQPADTPAVVVAEGLAEATGRPVELRNLSVVGARTADLRPQVDAALELFGGAGPDVVVVMVGANDVTRQVPARVSVRNLAAVVTTLRESGCTVVVACCPDLGTVEPVPNPLRAVGRRLSRTLAAAQAMATEAAGGSPVELGALLGPEFAAEPGAYFSEDRFHPSSIGYRRAAEVILPVLLRAVAVEQSWTEVSVESAATD
jgi:lysophospholipase L1-like esterase